MKRSSAKHTRKKSRTAAPPKRRSKAPSRPRATKASRGASKRSESEVAKLHRELNEAHEQQTATAEILKVIARSPANIQPVLDAIAENAARVCGADNCVIRLVQGDMQVPVAHFGSIVPLPPFPIKRTNIAGRAIVDAKTVHVPDLRVAEAQAEYSGNVAAAAGYRTVLATPLLRDGKAIGTIGMRRMEVRPFSAREIQTLEAFAAQAVIAIENVRLFNETKEALQQQSATAEILRVISSSPTDVQPVFDAIVKAGVQLFEGAAVAVSRPEGDQVTLAAIAEADIERREAWRKRFPFPLTRDYMHGIALLDCRMVDIPDVLAARDAPDAPERGAKNFAPAGYSAITIMPMMRDGAAIGTVSVIRPNPGPLSEKQLALLKTFADQAVIAIENVRLFNETKEALEQQTATAEILRVISSSPTNMQPVFDAIARNAALVCGAENAMIRVVDGEMHRPVAHYGDVPPLPPNRITAATLGARCIREARTVHVVDIADPSARAEYPDGVAASAGHRTVLGVPLLLDGKAIGLIGMRRLEKRPFTERQIKLLETFAAQAVIAIENVRLFNALESRNRDLSESLERQTALSDVLRVISESPTDSQPVFEAILENAMRLCGAHLGTLGLYDGTNYRHVAQRGGSPEFVRELFSRTFIPEEGSNLRRMLVDQEVVHVPDRQAQARPGGAGRLFHGAGARTVLSVPMVKDGRTIGGIVIYRPEVRLFTEHQINLVTSFASQAVIAIENVRLFNETREALEQQTATADILRVISSSPTDIQPVLDAVAESAARLCAADDVVIRLLDGNVHRAVAHHGPIQPSPPRELSASGVASRSMIEGCTVQDEDVTRGHHSASDNVRSQGVRTFLATPLLREGVSIGTIVMRRTRVQPFTDKQVRLLETFAAQSVIAIENVRLFNETKDALERQTATAEILRVISSSPTDTQPVFDAIVKSGLRLFGGMGVVMRLAQDGQLVRVASAMSSGMFAHNEPMAGPIDEGSVGGRAMIRGQTVQVTDCENSDLLSDSIRSYYARVGYKSAAFTPLMRDKVPIGALGIVRGTTGSFDEKHLNLLRTFADQAVIAIENVRLFKEIQDKTHELEAVNQQLDVASRHKSEFLASMSHELRTPLNAIIGFSEVLREQMFGEVNEKQAEYLGDIHSSSIHLLSLINDILDLSKIEAGRMDLELSRFNLPTALDNALTLIRERATKNSIGLKLDCEPDVGDWTADERKFKQITLNLLSNAVKFTPAGGTISVHARLNNGHVEIAVSDTGVGIKPEDQPLVFEEFKQVGGDVLRKAEGTGLGLALTKKFVELHGGVMTLTSEVGKGSTFTFTLPQVWLQTTLQASE